mgnify:CR=1 FL=1
MQNQRRVERYVDFDQMEYMPEIASAMDIYADEMTTYSDLTSMLNVKCPNEEIKAVLENLYSKILNVDYNLFGWARTMCKYGDFFLYLDIDDKYGVQSVISLPIPEIERLEGQDATNPNYIQYQWNSAGMTFENWQIAHFRVLGNDKHSPYGTSILDPARRIFRQLTLVEDAMMAYRVIRSSERRLFKIDVGGIPPHEVEQYMEKIVTQLKRHSVIDSSTGRVDLRYNPMSIEEDYFIPVRPGSATDITNLAGGQNTTAIEDVKYLRDKLFSALKIPQAYLAMGEGAAEDKTTLAQKDIRFARTIQRLQRVITAELEKIGIIHLYTLGFRGDDILQILLACDLRFGDMDFFHRHEQAAGRGAIQFSVANMMQPGVFDIDRMSELTTPGLLFFVTLPGPEDMMKAFDYMLETAQAVARNLGGDVLDESRSALTRQSLEHSRQKIRDLERRLLAGSR